MFTREKKQINLLKFRINTTAFRYPIVVGLVKYYVVRRRITSVIKTQEICIVIIIFKRINHDK